jgi:hypothetical protein
VNSLNAAAVLLLHNYSSVFPAVAAATGALLPLLFRCTGHRTAVMCCCRNIVQLRGVGASDLTDLVTMRESMFVVQVGPRYITFWG